MIRRPQKTQPLPRTDAPIAFGTTPSPTETKKEEEDDDEPAPTDKQDDGVLAETIATTTEPAVIAAVIEEELNKPDISAEQNAGVAVTEFEPSKAGAIQDSAMMADPVIVGGFVATPAENGGLTIAMNEGQGGTVKHRERTLNVRLRNPQTGRETLLILADLSGLDDGENGNADSSNGTTAASDEADSSESTTVDPEVTDG
jgi:hypothetical protein